MLTYLQEYSEKDKCIVAAVLLHKHHFIASIIATIDRIIDVYRAVDVAELHRSSLQ